MLVLLLFAFVAGVTTILTPCILPMVPLVLGTTSGGGRGRPLGVVLGLAVSFTLFTLIIGAALEAIGLSTAQLRIVAVLALAVFGLSLLVPAFGERLEILFAPLGRLVGRPGRTAGFAGGLALGATLGLVWAPCAGPILAAVIVAAATQGASLSGLVLALAYSLGAGLPLLLIGYGGRALVARARRLTSRTPRIQQAFGGLMIATALLIAFNLDLQLQDAALSFLPANWTATVASAETNAPIQEELQALTYPDNTPTPVVVAAESQALASPESTPLPVVVATEVMPAPTSTTAAATPTATTPQVALQNLGPAPEMAGLSEWINSAPLTMSELRGKVVLVHFWTFACINCIHVQPYVKDWYAKYKDEGFVVLGIHAPELSFEKVPENVRNNVKEKGIEFPVAIDPNFTTWSAYHNGYWPAFYYVDKSGQIRYTHVGEGAYDEQEQVIRQLLDEPVNEASR